MEEANQILHKTGEKLGETLQQVRRTTMRASEQVQSCFDARMGSLIVGIIMSVISGVAVLACIGGFVFVNVITNLGYHLDGRHRPIDMEDPMLPRDFYFRMDEVITILIVNAAIAVGLVFSLLEFSFSVVLADGASKRKIGHLKAYFVYCNVKSAILFIVSVVLFMKNWDSSPGYLTLLICGINMLMNMMVYMACKDFKKCKKGYSKFDSEFPVQREVETDEVKM